MIKELYVTSFIRGAFHFLTVFLFSKNGFLIYWQWAKDCFFGHYSLFKHYPFELFFRHPFEYDDTSFEVILNLLN